MSSNFAMTPKLQSVPDAFFENTEPATIANATRALWSPHNDSYTAQEDSKPSAQKLPAQNNSHVPLATIKENMGNIPLLGSLDTAALLNAAVGSLACSGTPRMSRSSSLGLGPSPLPFSSTPHSNCMDLSVYLLVGLGLLPYISTPQSNPAHSRQSIHKDNFQRALSSFASPVVQQIIQRQGDLDYCAPDPTMDNRNCKHGLD
jgi:hypothetical protein